MFVVVLAVVGAVVAVIVVVVGEEGDTVVLNESVLALTMKGATDWEEPKS